MEAPGDLEAAVLDALWDHGELSTPDVFEAVGIPRRLAYTTILTILQRLTKKGLLVRRAGGRSHIYTPALTRDEFAERRGESLAVALVQVGAAGVSAFLSEMQRLDPQAVAQFRKQLGAKR
jgi:predicted transcriptional regulator